MGFAVNWSFEISVQENIHGRKTDTDTEHGAQAFP